MNYSKNQTYGRKMVRGYENKVMKRVCASWVICFAIGFLAGCLMIWGITSLSSKAEAISYETVDEVSMDWGSDAETDFVPLDVPLDVEVQKYIHSLCYSNDIEFAFVMALIEHESSFRPDAINEKSNDFGLMQINEINHEYLTETLGITNYLDPYENVEAGVYMLKDLFNKYESAEKVLMAYNLGETGAKNLWEKGVYETDYSVKIIKSALQYKGEILEKESEQ